MRSLWPGQEAELWPLIFSSVCKKPEDYNDLFSPSEEAKKELEYWASFPVGQSTRISPVGLPIKTVDTDASDSSFGWYWKNDTFSDTFSVQ